VQPRGDRSWLPSVAPRAYLSTVHNAEQGEVAEDAVRLPLSGGIVPTGWADEPHRVAVA
jgi:urease accessory protein